MRYTTLASDLRFNYRLREHIVSNKKEIKKIKRIGPGSLDEEVALLIKHFYKHKI